MERKRLDKEPEAEPPLSHAGSREFDAGVDESTGTRTARARRNFRSVAKTR